MAQWPISSSQKEERVAFSLKYSEKSSQFYILLFLHFVKHITDVHFIQFILPYRRCALFNWTLQQLFSKQKNDTSLIFLKVGPNGLDVVCLTPPPLLLPLEKRQKEVKKQDILVFCNFLI